MIESDTDRLAMIRDAGQQVTVAGALIWVVFSENYIGALDGLVGSSSPNIFGRTSDLGDAARDTQVDVGGVKYTVVGAAQPDGTGMTRLMLKAHE